MDGYVYAVNRCLHCLRYYLICILLKMTPFAIGQNIPEDKILHYETVIFSLDSGLCSRHVISITNDTLIGAFRKALVLYPELCDLKIRLRYGNIKTSMAAQPRIISVFSRRDKRTYKVIINKNQQKEQTQLLNAVPFNASVGIMGHELAHILDYSSKSGWQLTWTGVRYLGKNYRRTMERQTDSVTIARGLGWQLYHFAYFLTNEAEISDAYRLYKLDTYMKPEEILEIILQK